MADPLLGNVNADLDRLMAGSEDLFGAPVAPTPLDVSAMAPPAQAAPPKRAGWKELGPLIALLPIAAQRGGRAGVSALLQGLMQGQQRQQQLERQTASDASLQQDRLLARQIQLAGLQDRRTTQTQQLQAKQAEIAAKFADALGKVDANDPAQVSALRDFFVAQGAPLGLKPEVLDARIASVLTPDRRMKAWAQKAYGAALSEAKGDLAEAARRNPVFTPPDSLREVGEDGQPKRYTLGELSRMVTGIEYDPTTLMAPPIDKTPAAVGSFEDYVRRTYGDAPTPQQIIEGRKVYNQADDRPRITVNTPGERTLTPTARANVIGSRRNQWMRFSKAVTDRQQSIAKLDSGVAALDRGNRNAATQAIILAFNKLQDETSVVREGEYARAEELAPITSRIEAFFVKLNQGGGNLTDKELRALAAEAKATAQALEAVTQGAARNVRQSIEEELADYGIPASRVFGNSEIGKTAPAAPAGNAPKVGDVKTFPNGKRGRWDGVGWEAIP